MTTLATTCCVVGGGPAGMMPAHCKFVALMPQWDFLNFLAGRAKDYSSFDLRMQHEAIGLVRDGERITGVEAATTANERRPGKLPCLNKRCSPNRRVRLIVTDSWKCQSVPAAGPSR